MVNLDSLQPTVQRKLSEITLPPTFTTPTPKQGLSTDNNSIAGVIAQLVADSLYNMQATFMQMHF
jgi:hypothetical protein